MRREGEGGRGQPGQLGHLGQAMLRKAGRLLRIWAGAGGSWAGREGRRRSPVLAIWVRLEAAVAGRDSGGADGPFFSFMYFIL